MDSTVKILVVDDDPTLGQMLKDVLEFKGYQVTVSKKPEKTQENILQNKIDLVILDKLISGIDGTEVCKAIRENPEISEIPVLMMSALNKAAEVCIEAGATEFLAKPFEMDELFVTVERVLQKEEK